MINKIVASAEAAVADIFDGATVMVGGFGTAGMPSELIDALIARGPRELTIVSNNAGNGETGLAALLKAHQVKKIICSFPRQVDSWIFDGLYRAGEIELELVPQGNLAERIRAAGAGIGAFYTPTGFGTPLAEGKETRRIDGRDYVLEYPIHADFALIKALRGDRWGNLVYRKTARNFGPIMAANHLPQDREIILHTENGLLGMGPAPEAGAEDADLINAGKQPVTTLAGASFFHHADSFAMMRGGHLDFCVLGAFQVSVTGDLANWHTGAPDAIPAVGGAMDLAIGAKRVYVMMEHLTKKGESKIVARCSYPLTGVGCVNRIFTDLAVLDVTPEGLKVLERAPELSFEELQRLTGVPLIDTPAAVAA